MKDILLRFIKANAYWVASTSVAAVMLLVVVVQKEISTATAERNALSTDNSRIVVFESFRYHDPYSKRDSRGYILQDRHTGQCYLYLWSGMGNGGPSIAPSPCP